MQASPLHYILCRAAPLLLFACLAKPADAQIPNTLLHSIPRPAVTMPGGGQLGYSVAVEGRFAVVGAPCDNAVGVVSGTVKVFDSTTGNFFFSLPNPGPAAEDSFGHSVAISGTLVVVGAPGDDTGATDAGSAYVYDLSRSTPSVPVATLHNPGPAAYDRFGESVAISGNRIVVGIPGDDSGADGAGSACVYDLSDATPAVPVTVLTNPEPAKGDLFGWDVAISGTRVVVGAFLDDAGAAATGAAYVFDLSGSTPEAPVVTLNKPEPAEGDQFGISVAIDGTLLVVGACRDDTGVPDAGSAFVYDLSNGATTVTVLNNPAPAPYDIFGFSVAISGTHVVVGAPWDEAEMNTGGSAYVYDMASGTPTEPVIVMQDPAPALDDYFGWSVALAGTRIVIGARFDDTEATDAGSAYMYSLTSANPAESLAVTKSPPPDTGAYFGGFVALSGRWLACSAHMDDTGADNAGSVYLFDLLSSTPTAPAITLHNPTPGVQDFFGQEVAMSGSRLVTGAYQDDTGASNAGSAYVFDLNSGTPSLPIVTLHNPTPAARDHFGNADAISGTRVVIGAPGDDTGATDAGSAYVYDVSSPTPTAPVVTLNNPEPGESEAFGSSVAISGTRVVVGTFRESTEGVVTARVHVYDLTSGTPAVPVITLTKPLPMDGDGFGQAIAISGTRVVAGAHGDDTGATNAGSAYVFDLASSTPNVPVATLHNPNPSLNDRFGSVVAITGTRVLIGADNDDTGAPDAGSAYLYDLGSGTPAIPVATFHNPNPEADDGFAWSVAIDGSYLAFGTPFTGAQVGKVYVYGPPPDGDSDGLRDAWELNFWPTTAGHGPGDDFDHDGYIELLELALGLNPTIPNPGGLPPVTNEGGYLTMTITKQPGVTYEVQSAGTVLPALPDSFSAANTTVLTNNATTLKVRDNFLIGTPPSRFLRVKVTAAP